MREKWDISSGEIQISSNHYILQKFPGLCCHRGILDGVTFNPDGTYWAHRPTNQDEAKEILGKHLDQGMSVVKGRLCGPDTHITISLAEFRDLTFLSRVFKLKGTVETITLFGPTFDANYKNWGIVIYGRVIKGRTNESDTCKRLNIFY
jgi:hypothetical protein